MFRFSAPWMGTNTGWHVYAPLIRVILFDFLKIYFQHRKFDHNYFDVTKSHCGYSIKQNLGQIKSQFRYDM